MQLNLVHNTAGIIYPYIQRIKENTFSTVYAFLNKDNEVYRSRHDAVRLRIEYLALITSGFRLDSRKGGTPFEHHMYSV